MVWQDYLITIVNIVFAYALLPQIYQGFRNKKAHINLQTGFLNTISLYALAFAFFTLNLTFSWIIVFLNATLWLTLFIQGIKYR